MELLDEAAERAAARTLPEPAPGRRPALGARELNGDLRHPASLGAASDAAGHKYASIRLQLGREWIRVPETAADELGKDGQVMDRFNALGRGAQLMLIGGVLLLIDLFLPWQDFGNEFSDAVGVDASFSGWRGVGGVLVGLLTIVLLAWLIVRLASVNVPLPVSTAMTAAIIGTLILIFTVIKLLTILGDEATIWAWVGLALAIVIAVGSFMTVQEAGGVETLRQEATSLSSSVSSSAPAAAAPAAAEPTTPPPPPPPAPPPAAESAASEAAPATPSSDAADAAADAASDEPSNPQSS